MHGIGGALVIVAAAGAGLCWLAAVVSWLRMLGNTSGRMSVPSMLLHGMASFDPANFNERGQRLQRLFLRCFAGFFGMLLVLAATAAATAALQT
jgi:hypothetical protein